MKDDVLILNTLGRRHLPRLLPVIILAAAAVTVAVICNGSLEFGLFPNKYGNVTNYRGYLYAGSLLFIVLCVELVYASIVLVGPRTNRFKYRYTVSRLKITERRAFLLCCLFNILVYLLIWASLCCAALIFGRALNNAGVFGTAYQGLYTAYILDPYMQLFVPMDNVQVTVSMIMFMVGFGLWSACDFAGVVKGKAVFPMTFAVLVFFWASGFFNRGGGLIGWTATASFMLIVSICMVLYRRSQLSRGNNVEVDDGE
ncbi:MAG: hypothetical protein IJM61_02045 [Firmicutes bacterium]|nr:hypothetical protein [Bacillota bacterium]